MPGPPAKPAERRARRNVDAVNAVVPIADRPDPPAGLSPEGITEWNVFWDSPLGKLVTPTDLPALRRLFELREEAAEAHSAYQLFPTVVGSMGQSITNPEGKHALALDDRVTALEDRFGLNPKARLGMGVRIGQVADAAERHPGLLAKEGQPRADPRLPDATKAPAQRRRAGGRLDGGQSRSRRG